jgi:hypothetical protein
MGVIDAASVAFALSRTQVASTTSLDSKSATPVVTFIARS